MNQRVPVLVFCLFSQCTKTLEYTKQVMKLVASTLTNSLKWEYMADWLPKICLGLDDLELIATISEIWADGQTTYITTSVLPPPPYTLRGTLLYHRDSMHWIVAPSKVIQMIQGH